MYTKDKAQRITLRLNEDQFAFVRTNAEMLGVSPSDFLRMVINVTMATERAGRATVRDNSKDFAQEMEREILPIAEEYKKGRAERRENETTHSDDQLQH